MPGQVVPIQVTVTNLPDVVRLAHAADYVLRHAETDPADPDVVLVPDDAVRLLKAAHDQITGGPHA